MRISQQTKEQCPLQCVGGGGGLLRNGREEMQIVLHFRQPWVENPSRGIVLNNRIGFLPTEFRITKLVFYLKCSVSASCQVIVHASVYQTVNLLLCRGFIFGA